MKLFEPIIIHRMEAPNRIVYPAIQMNMGLTNRRARAYYAERAHGGAGIVTTANVSIDNLASEELWGGPEELDGFISRLRRLVDQVHDAGSLIGLQLWQANRFPQGRGVLLAGVETDPGGGDRVAPSDREDMRELTIPEIEAIIYRFAKGSLNVRKAGFDFVELHGAHLYLPCQFTSPEHNTRTDKYGGDPKRRMQFGIDLVKAVRAFVGPEFPVFFRLGVLEKDDETHPDSIAYAKALEKAGVDCLNVSLSGVGRKQITPTKRQRMGTFAHFAEAIKKNVNIPVIAVGRINSPKVAEKIIETGQADMVAIGRQLIADPFWPQKVRENRFSDVIACDSCNINCYSSIYKRKLPENAPLCKNNPRVGREWEIPAPPKA
ncbi:tRNA-dihydrouridine synthase [Thermodesulfobacteriota bacterium]